jgi:CheY-like chemotaxis protein
MARNGQEALGFVETAAPALIVLDLRMPVMDGREFGTRIRACPDWANIPIIILSADQNAESTARELDAVGCLGKPFQLSDLLGLVHSMLSVRCGIGEKNRRVFAWSRVLSPSLAGCPT